MPIEIPEGMLHDVYKEARAAFPYECCGWLYGAAGGELHGVRVCVNQQASGDHPTAPGRGAETAYMLGSDDLLAFNRAFDGVELPLVFYHSHPNGRAYFSATDREVAASPWGDGPAYPVQQLVVGIDAEAVREAAQFAWSEEARDFVEVGRYPGAAV